MIKSDGGWLEVQKNDISKIIYFIAGLVRAQENKAMMGAIGSRGDLMGGIFDRWVNLIPESIIFNKYILPEITGDESVKVISDFYKYEPKEAGIAPDVIGLNIRGKLVRFAYFDNHWKPEKNMPQIEIKSLKESQRMLSLRNQKYDGEYLVIVETDLRIDYLLPFFSRDIFTDEVYNELKMNDNLFIENDSKNCIEYFDKITDDILGNTVIGRIRIRKITTADDFMRTANLCKGGVTPYPIDGEIREVEKTSRYSKYSIPLSTLCCRTPAGLYRFNENRYRDFTVDGHTFKGIDGTKKQFLDMAVEGIENIIVRDMSGSTMHIEAVNDSSINGRKLSRGKLYKIEYRANFKRTGEKEEYFIQKSLVDYIPDYKEELYCVLKKIIKDNS